MEFEYVTTDQSRTQIIDVGDILSEELQSDSPLAVGYRNWKSKQRKVEQLNADGNGKA